MIIDRAALMRLDLMSKSDCMLSSHTAAGRPPTPLFVPSERPRTPTPSQGSHLVLPVACPGEAGPGFLDLTVRPASYSSG